MRRTLCLLPFVLAAPLYCAGQSSLVDLLPSDSQIVFGIKVHGLLDSELARNFTAEMKGQTAEWQTMLALSGFDPFNDLDEILIASTGAGDKAPTLVVARGKFDIAKLAPNADSYKGVPLVSSKTLKGEGAYGFLDESTALAGDPESVKAAIDHLTEPSHLDSKLASQIAEYRDHYDVWAVVNRTDGLAKLVPQSSGQAAAGLDSIDHFQFGVSMKKGLELAAEVHARSTKDADQLLATLQFLEAMSKASQPPDSKGTKFAFHNEDGTVKISLAVSEEELRKTIEAQRKAGMFGPRAPQPGAESATVAPVAPAPAQPDADSAAAAPVAPAPVPTVAEAHEQPPVKAQAHAPAPVKAQPPAQPVAPGVGPDDGRTAVFTLPSRP